MNQRAIQTTQKINWVKYLTALIIIPAVIFIPRLLGLNETNSTSTRIDGQVSWSWNLVQGFGIYLALFFAAIYYWSDGILKPSWQKWRQHWVRNAFFALIAMIVMMVVLVPGAKAISGYILSSGTVENSPVAAALLQTTLPTMLMLFIPLLQAFTEEIVYHHALIAPFAGRKGVYVLASIIANLIFAAVHINNVSGSIPYLFMYFVMGVFFQLMYHFGNRNIWQNIMTHLFYNGLITVIGLIGLIMTLFIK
ncbi:MAG TPA: type II CAAX endopeptidase family protein [Lactobacillaceae bacterium]